MQQFSLSYHSIYTRNWRVVGAIWVLCGLCTSEFMSIEALYELIAAVLQTLALIHPTWIGNDEGGYFGLYDYCGTSECPWSPFRVRPLSMWFEISAFLVLAATVLSFLAIFSILLLVLLRDRHAFILCSWLHFFAFVFMLAGCILYPYGWENPRVREICESRKYQIGLCQIRWPYLLAMVLVFDQLCLCCLGFALALKKPPKLPELSSLTGPTVISNTIQPVPRPRKMSLQDSFYSHSGSRLEL
uniref:G_PROTEIN_RECEP_F1_2 domain-containing protein n=1 Tax=Caenorhabditis tropicalis TaxID=1561998 RepID=A0A1I7T0A4_9PELO